MHLVEQLAEVAVPLRLRKRYRLAIRYTLTCGCSACSACSGLTGRRELCWHEVAEAEPGGQVVGRVLPLGRLDDVNLDVPAVLLFERGGDGSGMLLAWLILVRDDDDFAAKELCVLRPPFARAAGVACRHGSGRLEGVHVLFALADPDFPALADSGSELREVIQHTGNALQVPRPPGFG